MSGPAIRRAVVVAAGLYERLRLLPRTEDTDAVIGAFEELVRAEGPVKGDRHQYVWSRSEGAIVRLPFVEARSGYKADRGPRTLFEPRGAGPRRRKCGGF